MLQITLAHPAKLWKVCLTGVLEHFAGAEMKLDTFEIAIFRAGLRDIGATAEDGTHILANISVSSREVAGSGAYI